MMVDCAGLRDDVIWAGVTQSFCFYCGQRGKIGVVFHKRSLTANPLMSMHGFCSKPETPVCVQAKPKGMTKSKKQKKQINR